MDQTTTRDASEVGIYCSVCKALDFLPFQCQFCRLPFCKDHSENARPERHQCDAQAARTSQVAIGEDGKPMPASSEPSASFKSLLPDRSPQASRGEPTPEQLEKEQKKQAALVMLQKNFPKASSSTSSLPKPANKPVNKTVALMKMKRAAKPADPRRTEKQVTAVDRRYLTVREEASGKTVEVWLPKDCSCGKALDLLADMLGVENKNNLLSTPASQLVYLKKASDSCNEGISIASASTVGSVTADGDEIWIVRGTQT